MVRRAMSSTSTESESLKRQFALHRLLSASGAVKAQDLIVSEGRVSAFTMPILEGCSLAEVGHSLTPMELLGVLRDIALTTFSLHVLGYIHGDLSANNVWVTEAKHGREGILLDFGFTAQIGTRSLTEVRGTRGHIPPEASLGRPLGPHTDAYSFGMMLDHAVGFFADRSTRGRLSPLIERCTAVTADERLSDFSVIYSTLMQLARERFDAQFSHSQHQLPLRLTGLRSKTKSVSNCLDAIEDGGVIWIVGDSGSGKSELMRSVCQDAQECGSSTLRFSEVQTMRDCTDVLESLLNDPDAVVNRERLVVFVETSAGFRVDSHLVKKVREIALDRRVAIVIESRRWPSIDLLRGSYVSACSPFTFRECMQATGHLLANRGIIVQNAEAVTAVTGGCPRRVRAVMTKYFFSGRRGRGEPVDCCQRMTAEIVHSFSEVGSDDTGGDRWHGVGNDRGDDEHSSINIKARLMRSRAAVGTLLREYRRRRKLGITEEVSLCLRLSDHFGELGSIRRQSYWMQAAVSAYSRIPLSECSDRELSDYVSMLGRSLPPVEVITRLKSLFNTWRGPSMELRCLVSTELGAAYLHAKMPNEAQLALHDALALSSKCASSSRFVSPILNRLGTAKMLLHDYSAARQYFTQASRVAQMDDDQSTLTRVEGNLGFLALHNAEPLVALQWLQRHKNGVLRIRQYSDYLSNLLNQARCYVDLGKALAAERRSRLAILLAEMLADDMRMAYAQNNLGWIMSMRCRGKLAMDCFSRSIAIRAALRDYDGVAQTLLNVARLHLLARSYDFAEDHIRQAEEYFERLGNLEGIWDSQRLLVKRSLLLADYDRARIVLEQLLANARQLSQKDFSDALLLKLEMLLWTGSKGASAETLKTLDAIPAVMTVHPIRVRRCMLGGYLAMVSGEFDAAHMQMSTAISMSRESNREDLVLEGTTIMAVLAHRMDNSATGLRYLRYVQEVAAQLEREIKCQTGSAHFRMT